MKTLAAFLLLLAALVLPRASFAALEFNYSGSNWSGPIAAACNAWAVGKANVAPYTYCSTVTAYPVGTATCQATCNGPEYGGPFTFASREALDPAGAKVVLDALKASGNVLASDAISIGDLSVCYHGFVVKGGGTMTGLKNGAVVSSALFGPFTADGTSCTAAPTVPLVTGDGKCKVGYMPTFTGTDMVCVPSSNMNISQSEKTTAPPASAASGSTPAVSGIAGAPAATVEAVKSVSCVGEACTEKTVFKDGAGASLGQKETQLTLGDLCTKSPGLALCSTPKSECEKNPKSIGCSEYGTPVAQSLTGLSFAAGVTPVSFSSATGCPADLPVNFTVGGHVFSQGLSFSPLCSALSTYVKPILLLLAFGTAAFVVVGGMKL